VVLYELPFRDIKRLNDDEYELNTFISFSHSQENTSIMASSR